MPSKAGKRNIFQAKSKQFEIYPVITEMIIAKQSDMMKMCRLSSGLWVVLLFLVFYPGSPILAEDAEEENWQIPLELEDDYRSTVGGNEKFRMNGDQPSVEPNSSGGDNSIRLPGAVNLPESVSAEGNPMVPGNGCEFKTALFNGEIPLYEGGKIIRDEFFNPNASGEMRIPAETAQVFDYYKSIMPEKGWTMDVSMKEKNGGLLSFSRTDLELVFRIEDQDGWSKVTVDLAGKRGFKSLGQPFGFE
jgi:hypothetical protein